MAFWDGGPPRAPCSFGHAMPAKPSRAFCASHSRRRLNDSSEDLCSQKSLLFHSSVRFASSQARNSLRNCASSALSLRSTPALCPNLLTSNHAVVQRDGLFGDRLPAELGD